MDVHNSNQENKPSSEAIFVVPIEDAAKVSVQYGGIVGCLKVFESGVVPHGYFSKSWEIKQADMTVSENGIASYVKEFVGLENPSVSVVWVGNPLGLSIDQMMGVVVPAYQKLFMDSHKDDLEGYTEKAIARVKELEIGPLQIEIPADVEDMKPITDTLRVGKKVYHDFGYGASERLHDKLAKINLAEIITLK